MSAIERCQLNLTNLNILTEAATGPYVVTPIIAALAGAKVSALARKTRFGTVDDIRSTTMTLASVAGVSARIRVFEDLPNEIISEADVVTNSGHVRPIDAAKVGYMKRTAVVPLMYEAWEFRDGDVDLSACERHGVSVAGTNERHPAIDVFSFLGIMAVKLLLDAGISVYDSAVLVLCDNPFGPFIENGLARAGAHVICVPEFPTEPINHGTLDAILIAVRPGSNPALSAFALQTIADFYPGAVVTQFWGDVDRPQMLRIGIPFSPENDIPPGHMGILPSALGPEPVIRLQSGGLKVGEVMAVAARCGKDPITAAVKSGFGQSLAADWAYTSNRET
jgi:hypothetical protein